MLRFWFPPRFEQDQVTLAHQWQRWFRGGGDAEIIQQFSSLLAWAIRGELDDWSQAPHSRLALILVLETLPISYWIG